MITVKCNLCGRDDWFVRFPATFHAANGAERPSVAAFSCTNPGYGSHPQIVQCRHCGFVYANPRWPADVVLDAYSAVEDATYVAEREGRERTFTRHLQTLERIVGPAGGRRLLDVGAYIGVFVEVAAASGWEAWGVEPSEWAAAEAQKRGLRVIRGTLDAPELQETVFDVITMWDVVEHLTDPAATLAAVYQRLRPGGWLAVHTMDIDAPLARLMGRHWPWLMDMHLYYFSRRTLALMLHDCGFDVRWARAQGRFLRLGYLASRVAGIHPALGRLVGRLVQSARLNERAVAVNFGDLLTMVAQRR